MLGGGAQELHDKNWGPQTAELPEVYMWVAPGIELTASGLQGQVPGITFRPLAFLSSVLTLVGLVFAVPGPHTAKARVLTMNYRPG